MYIYIYVCMYILKYTEHERMALRATPAVPKQVY